ncbi:MAG: hypothetical protein ABIJ46_03560 [bacterium]
MHLVLLVGGAALIVALVVAGFVLGERFKDAPSSGAPVLSPDPAGGLVDDFVLLDDTPDDSVGPVETPIRIYGPEVPPAPPPVSIGPLNSQRLRRVEFYPPVGDVFRLDYDPISDTLLMAVVEADGMRSIWRLSGEERIERVLQENDRPGEIFLGSDSLGFVYAGFADPGTLYRSIDRGASWRPVAEGIDGTFWGIADDGAGTLWGSLHSWNTAWLYRSTDGGLSWSRWLDFQDLYPEFAATYREGDDRFALRHLHDVAYSGGRLFVGVGDVARFTAMSEDGGLNWRHVWSEGFTAHVDMPGGGLLLGPDRLQAHGLARYDAGAEAAEEVWSPVPHGWSGFTYSLARIDGSYFAAFHNETNEVERFSGRSGVVVSPDGERWYPFLEIDALTNWARTDIFLAPRRDWSGWITLNGALYVFETPIGRWFDVHQEF